MMLRTLAYLGSLIIVSLMILTALPAPAVAQSGTTPSMIFIPLITSISPPLPLTWLERVNSYRMRAGVPPVTEISTLSDNCWQHARYMAENNHLTHEQDFSKPYASEAGQTCGTRGNAWIGYGSGWQPADAIDSWMASIGHRLWLLYPTTPSFGFGFYTISNGQRSAAALDVLSQFNDGSSYPSWPVRYPGDGQTDVPATKYPITLHWRYFGSTPTVSSVTLNVVGGEAIPYTVTTSLPANHKGIAITPVNNLPANSLIKVTVSGLYDGQPFTLTWQFQTGS